MNIRLIWAIISNILEEAAIVAIVVWFFPRYGIRLPLWVLVILMLAWLSFSVFTYRKGTRALLQKPVKGLTDMVGSTGKVVEILSPDGMVIIKGEIWHARSAGEKIVEGEQIEVVGQQGLKLIVRKPGR